LASSREALQILQGEVGLYRFQYLSVKDPALLMALRESKMVLVGFDRSSMPMHAGKLTREGLGHAGVILFRRSVSAVAYGMQARLLVNFWREAGHWDWADRIEYLPRNLVSFGRPAS
jgi:hypothetical protein